MPFEIVRANIIDMHVDAIVNSANPHAIVGRGVDSAIHAAAGPELLRARECIGDIAVGDARATEAFNLPARLVIHTVGPLWQGGNAGEEAAVASCYTKSLELAANAGCTSIAFPLISTGTYGFPKDLALQAAMRAIQTFLRDHDMMVYLVVYDAEAFRLSQDLQDDVADYIAQHLSARTCPVCGARADDDARFCCECGSLLDRAADDTRGRATAEDELVPEALWSPGPPARGVREVPPWAYQVNRDERPSLVERALGNLRLGSVGKRAVEKDASALDAETADFGSLDGLACASEEPAPAAGALAGAAPFGSAAPAAQADAAAARRSLDEMISQVEETFSEALLRTIDERGLDDPTVYKRANIDRKLFSKIRSNPAYQPKKTTALALAIALELSLDETLDLIGRAGYTLSHANVGDLIVEYFIERGCFDLFTINETLFSFDQPLIGC